MRFQRFKNLAIGISAALGSVTLIAASSFTPSNQPLGYIAPSALDKTNIAGGATAFVPWFRYGDYHGDLLAVPVSASGAVNLLTPRWRARDMLALQDWDTGRFIVTTHTEGYPVPFRKDDLDGGQKDLFKSDEEKRINWFRGDRQEEGDKFRERAYVLGDIVHSNPVYVGKPVAGYPHDNYPAFASANDGRAGRVYVGANDGMLHAFDAATGAETFAYVPSMVLPKMKGVSEMNYVHDYLVDGPLTAQDAKFSGGWHTVLVGGLGAGGKGLFALDVTSAAPISDESNLASGAGSRVMWEFSSSSAGGTNLGYTYSRPAIVQLNDGSWAVAVGNGYLSSATRASLLLLDVQTGSVIRELVVTDSDGNGMSSPTLIDADNDYRVDYAYAGDLNGNLWKFDLTGSSPFDWHVAHSGEPLFEAADGQAFTSAPDVGVHPEGGFFVYAGTGRLLSMEDGANTSEQHVYGIWDKEWAATEVPVTPADLVAQTLTQTVHAGASKAVRTATANQPDWATQKGWQMSLNAAGGASGERIIQDMSLRGGKLRAMTTNPATTSGESWLLQLDAHTGGAPSATVFDVTDDGAFDVSDNVDGDGNGAVEDSYGDRVTATYMGFGLVSRPTIAVVDEKGDSAITNRLSGVRPLHVDEPPSTEGSGGEDFGIVGGHFDLDVSSQTYPLEGGETDKHKHQWDDSYGPVVDLFDILGDFRSVDDIDGMPGESRSSPFIISVSNAHLSPGAVYEINGIDIPVVEYRALVKSFIDGALPAGAFPVFKLNAPTPAEAAAGIQQLTSLKIKFSADVIALGGIHPTATGCVKGNDSSPNGEYRNGALTTQMLDASDISGGYTWNPALDGYSTGSHKIHRLGYALPKNGVHEVGDGMYWESTIFWHWGGGCYDTDKIDEYRENYEEEVGLPDDRGDDDDIPSGGTDPGDDGSGDGDGGGGVEDPVDEDADTHEVENILLSAGDRLGRLFWRELIPDN